MKIKMADSFAKNYPHLSLFIIPLTIQINIITISNYTNINTCQYYLTDETNSNVIMPNLL
jgi:hypothetical protein